MNNIKQNLINLINSIENVTFIEEKDWFKIDVSKEISVESLLEFLKELFIIENELSKEGINNIWLNLRGLDNSILLAVFDLVLKTPELNDIFLINNLINLAKANNTLDDSFFENEKVYFTDLIDFVDFRIELDEKIENFIKTLSIFFISLFYSYNKVEYSELDPAYKLPAIYHNILLSTDLLTLSGIFSLSNTFSTKECVNIENSALYVTKLLLNSNISTNLMNNFFMEIENANTN